MKRIWWLIPFSLVLGIMLCHCASTGNQASSKPSGGCVPKDFSQGLHNHPTVRLARHYVDVDDNCMFIVPYYLDIMAIHSLNHGKHIEEVRDFIDWTFAHLNYTDRWGFSGTVFDYVICCDGTEMSTRQYDSADGYAGQFLMLMEAYYKQTNDKSIINKHRKQLFDIARVIIELQDKEDGLSIAMEGYPVKYLMDNAEAYGGLCAFVRLGQELGWKQLSEVAKARDAMKKGLLEDLFDSDRKIFYWAIEDDHQQISNWSRYYPDALAQVFPILYDVIPSDSELARQLWKNFKSRYGNTKNRDIEQKLLVKMTKEKMAENG